MPLPQIVSPTYRLKLPSTGKEIQYRPFIVKEEKILTIALESQDEKQIIDAIKTVLKNCINTRGIKVDELPIFDIEYIFLNIRSKSIGEKVQATVTCPDDGETTVDVLINLDEVQVEKQEGHTNQIDLGNNMMVKMKYPSLDQFVSNNFETLKQGADSSFDIIASCIEMVYQGEEAWSAKDCSKKELVDWVMTMEPKHLRDLDEKFFQTMPVLKHTIKVTNPNTNVESEIVLEGLANFFA